MVAQSASWGFSNPGNLTRYGLTSNGVASLQHSVFNMGEISPSQAVTGFALVFGASSTGHFAKAPTESTLAMLASIATPARIRDFMGGLGHSQSRFERVMHSVEAIVEAQVGSGLRMASVGAAQARWSEAQESLNPRPFGFGGGSIRPSVKGPGVRASDYQRAAEEKMLREIDSVFAFQLDERTGKPFAFEMPRLRRYGRLLADVQGGKLKPGEFARRLRHIWENYASQLEDGGHLAEGAQARVAAMVALELGETGNIWDQTVAHITE